MFYKHILSNLNYSNPNLIKFISHSPSHHKYRYYKELHSLESQGILELIAPVKRYYDREINQFIFTGAEYRVANLTKLEILSSQEDEYIPEKYQPNKLISIINEYNQQPYIDCFSRMKFNKGRATNVLSFATTEKQEHLDKKSDRSKYLDTVFGHNNWIHYDVPSSIPQVIHLMNKGFWLNERVWDMLGDSNIKPLGQRIMFNTTEFGLARSIYQFDTGKKKSSPSKSRYIIKEAGRMSEYYYYMATAKNYSNMLQNIIGPFPGDTREERAKVFIHESNIYLLVLQKFMQKGVKVVEVYDSFYWDRNSGITIQQVENWVKECAEYYYSNRSNLFTLEIQKANVYMQSRKVTLNHLSYKSKRSWYEDKYNESKIKVNDYVRRNKEKAAAGIFPRRWTDEEKELGRKKVSEVLTTNTSNNNPAPANSLTTNNTLTHSIPFVSNLVEVKCCAKLTNNSDTKDANLEKPTALPSGLSFAKSSLGAE